MLTFLGFGSELNVELGNTSAFYKKNENMLLIDCGGTVFKKLIDNNILDDIKNIWITITCLHGDHCGSLSNLIFYMYFVKNIKVHIISTGIKEFDDLLKKILEIQCVSEAIYEESSSKIPELDLEINFIKTNHDIDPIFSLDIKLSNKHIYYSGNTSEICRNPDYYDYIYQGVSFFNDSLYCKDNKLVEYELFKEKVYLMYINNSSKIKLLKKQGFKIVGIVKERGIRNFILKHFFKK